MGCFFNFFLALDRFFLSLRCHGGEEAAMFQKRKRAVLALGPSSKFLSRGNLEPLRQNGYGIKKNINIYIYI